MDNRYTPQHVAIIMDGNGRWAERRNLPKEKGHKAGAETLRTCTEFFARHTSVKYVTVFAFAQANQKRDRREKMKLSSLLISYAQQVAEFLSYNCRVRFVGNRADGSIDIKVLHAMASLERATVSCSTFFLQIAWNYSGSDELIRAQKAGFDVSQLYQTMFDAQDVPAVDLMIRTGVENPVSPNWRQSDFLPLLSANAVNIPLKCLWPDFGQQEIEETFQNWRSESHLCGASRR